MKVEVLGYTSEQYDESLQKYLKLFEQYAHLISKTHSGLETVPGWFDIVSKVFNELDTEDTTKLHIQQIKNRMGVLQVFYEGGDVRLYQRIRELEDETIYVCEMCGLPGEKITNSDGSIQTRCKWHQHTEWRPLRDGVMEEYLKKLKKLNSKFTTEWE